MVKIWRAEVLLHGTFGKSEKVKITSLKSVARALCCPYNVVMVPNAHVTSYSHYPMTDGFVVVVLNSYFLVHYTFLSHSSFDFPCRLSFCKYSASTHITDTLLSLALQQ